MKSCALIFLLSATLAHASPRTSASYTIPADTLDGGGGRAASLSYTESASMGTTAGTAGGGDPVQLLKAGLLARFFDVTGLTLTSATPSVNEGASVQLGAWQVLDDSTFLHVPAAGATWNVSNGPLSGIDTSGFATAGIVYQDSAAEISGTFGGFTGTISLTIRNVNTDDFGTYASDELPDGWQVQYFGLDNPLGAPGVDASGTGQTNLFKYAAGLDPTDPASRFTLEIEPVNGQPAQKDLIFTPVFPDRTYLVEYTTDLASGVWLPLPGALENTAGQVRTVTDPAADQVKFYRVRITKPQP